MFLMGIGDMVPLFDFPKLFNVSTFYYVNFVAYIPTSFHFKGHSNIPYFVK